MNREEIAKIVKVIDHGWPQSRLSVATVAIYSEGLKDLPYQATDRAVAFLLRTSEFRPAVATIRKTVAQALGQLPPPVDQAARQALEWLDYQEQLGFVNGSGYEPTPPRVHRLVKRACAMSGDHHHPAWMTAFRRNYEQLTTERTNRVLASPMDAIPETRALEA